MKVGDELYTKRISTIKGHRQQDIPLETRDIKRDRLKVIIIKRTNNVQASNETK